MRKRVLYLAFLLVALAAVTHAPQGAAQQAVLQAVGPAPQGAPQATPVTRLSIRPAAPPELALKYMLLPRLIDRTPGNAAPLYYTAVLLIPGTEATKSLDKVSEWINMPTDELLHNPEVNDALGYLASGLHYVELAARREKCDWEIPLDTEGPATLLPDLVKYRALARGLAVRARLEIARGEYEKALRTLQTGFSMARHIGEGPTLIHGLVAIAIASIMEQQVEELVQAPGSPNLYWALTALPTPLIDLRTEIEYEMSGLEHWVPELRDAQKGELSAARCREALFKVFAVLTEEWPVRMDSRPSQKLVLGVTAAGILAYPDAKRFLVEHGRNAQEVEAMPVAQALVEYMVMSWRRISDEHLKWVYLPYWQADEGLRQFEKSLPQPPTDFGVALAEALMPAIRHATFRMVSLDRRIAALRCVEAVRIHAASHKGALPASLSDVTEVPIPVDPVTGKQFDYRAEGNRASLSGPLPPDMPPDKGLQYELTLVP